MRKVKYILSLVVVSFVTNIIAQPNFEWAIKYGNSNIDHINDQVIDNNGMIYSVGYFTGTVDFNPGPGIYNLTSNGAKDIFITKIDRNGNLVWAVNLGWGNDDIANDIEIDPSSGNLVITGSFMGTSVDFDPGIGVYNLSTYSSASVGAFVLKLDVNAGFIWARGSNRYTEGASLTVSPNGNICVGVNVVNSQLGNSISFGIGYSFASNSVDFFIWKLNSSAAYQLIKQGYSSASPLKNNSMISDNSDNVIIALTHNGGVNLTDFSGPGVSGVSGNDVLVFKINNNGSHQWNRQFASSSNIVCNVLHNVNNNAFYLGGNFWGSINFNPPFPANSHTSAGQYDGFVVGMDFNNNVTSSYTFGGTSTEYVYDITTNSAGELYAVGGFYGTADMDGSTATNNLTSGSGADAYILKLNSSGNYSWAVGFGPGTDEFIYAVNVSQDTLYCAGDFSSTVDFDPSASVYNLTASGNTDIFTLKFGDCVVASPTLDVITACNSYTWIDNNTYTTSNNTATYTIVGGAANGCDSVVKLNLTINNTATGTDVITACNSYTWIDNNNYTTSNNTATHTIVNGAANGCDSVVTLNLTINNTATGTDVITACDSYTWIDNNTYTTSNNTATHTIVNGAANGCDSVVTLNLTINNTATGTDVITACNSYTWIDNNNYTTSNNTATHTIVNGAANGCDSVVTLNLTINNTATGTDVITACNSYTWIDNNTYTASNNTATHTIVNGAANGCDSVVTLNLTINTVDNSTSTQGNDSIMANATGATYQWLDCNNNYAIISGATNQLFVASANGSYAVEVTQNSCTDTSNCVTISGVGIDELTTLNLSVYPNPTTGNVTIELERLLPNISFQVKNIVGQTIETKTYFSTNKIEFNLEGDKGIYFLIVENEHTNRVFKILKQ